MMANKWYKCNKCDYVSKQCHEMIVHVLQAHFNKNDVPVMCRVCSACKATIGAFHCHNRKNHPMIHPGGLAQALGNRVNMTEQDLILSHFVEVNQDVAEPGTRGEGASTPEASDNPSTSGVGPAHPPDPGTNASTSKSSMDQAVPSPE